MNLSEDMKLHAIVATRNAFFSEVGIGTLANTFLLLSYTLIFLLQSKPRPMDLIIIQLALIHIMVLMTTGFLVTNIFGSSHFWNDFTCKLVIYISRLSRNLSICTSCLLSILQAITLSPQSSCLAKFKHKSSQHSLYCLFLLWLFNMSMNTHFFVSIFVNLNVSSTHVLFVAEFCSVWPQNYFLMQILFTLMIFRDVTFIGLMLLSSGYMVTVLYRHRKLSRQLHSTSLSPRAAPEKRATQTILLLMGFFGVMYIMDCIMSSSRTVWANDPVRLYVQVLVANAYATISPFVLISTEKRFITLRKTVTV
ncbi:vomeronasal type-1 receptor 90-like [Erinaceus europaeus]|uniref:Vomeronasal type-1 receptor n=1 Tax=Erinaceus europaeus TaxID=9365 RepID=A0A1S2ZCC2_ERIEU|nr:vomeronasal type-1 receptor 90-like [Erinaceus europaeus]